MNERADFAGTLVKYISLVVVAAVASGALTYLAIMNVGYTVSVDKAGKVTIAVRPSDNFPEIFKKAIAADPKIVDTTLASENYYKLTDTKLVSVLEDIDYSTPQNQKLAWRIRKMLYDLRGPFQVPGALRDAPDYHFVEALDDLDNALQSRKPANAILAELWKQSLNREGIFKIRYFRATVEVVPGAASGNDRLGVVLACPGSPVGVGKVMQLYAIGQVLAEVTQNPLLFHCDRAALTAEQLLADQTTVRLGVSEAEFRRLAGSDTIDRKIDATFILYPKDQMARIPANFGM
jgi:hypothetical protein